jgi:chromosome segregation ATPase
VNEEKTYQEEYNDFWRDIVENEDGTLNKDQVMRELSDYSMVMDNCARAFYTMTNGRISKQNTKFFEVENIFNDLYTDTETYYEDMAEKDKEIERLNNIINKIKEELEAYIRLCVDVTANDILDMVEHYIKGEK